MARERDAREVRALTRALLTPRWRLRIPGGALVLTPRSASSPPSPLPPELATRMLLSLDPRRPEVRATLDAIARSGLFAADSRGAARDRVVALLRGGQLVALRERAVVPTLRPEYVEPEDTSLPASEVRTWIEIELVDMNDKPVPDRAYRIELPDGRVRTGTLDREGRAREDGLVPGTCKVSFPELDGRAWRRA